MNRMGLAALMVIGASTMAAPVTAAPGDAGMAMLDRISEVTTAASEQMKDSGRLPTYAVLDEFAAIDVPAGCEDLYAHYFGIVSIMTAAAVQLDAARMSAVIDVWTPLIDEVPQTAMLECVLAGD